MTWLLEPLQFEFMRYALLAMVLAAIPLSLLSCFLVVRGWALMGDALSHAVLPGVVLAYALGLPLLLGAFLAGLFCAAAVGFIDQKTKLKEDTAMGVVFTGLFALGLVLFSVVHSNLHLNHILFGDALGVESEQLWQIGAVTASVVVLMLVFGRDWQLQLFDPIQARTMGLPVGRLHYGLLVILSMSIVSALSTVGIIIAMSLLILPGATLVLMRVSMRRMLWLSPILGSSAALIGGYLSFYLDSAPAPTMVLAMGVQFCLALLAQQYRDYRVPKLKGAP